MMANKHITCVLLALALLAGSLAARGQEAVRGATFTIAAGTAHMADTYLSPIKYNGANLRLAYDRWGGLGKDAAGKVRPWTTRLQVGVDGQYATHDNGYNGELWAADLSAQWAAMATLVKAKATLPLTVGVGPAAMLEAGAFYNHFNGNNPANAKAMMAVGASAFANYGLRLFKKDVSLRLSASLPLLGAFFSPEYGELYYEIYLGDRQGLVNCAHPGSYFDLTTELSAYVTLGRHVVQVGYRLNRLSSEAHHLITNRTTHSLVIGIGLK